MIVTALLIGGAAYAGFHYGKKKTVTTTTTTSKDGETVKVVESVVAAKPDNKDNKVN